MQQDPKVIAQWLETLEYEGKGLTKWEQDFLDSVKEQFETKNWLSDKQEEILERIYADKT